MASISNIRIRCVTAPALESVQFYFWCRDLERARNVMGSSCRTSHVEWGCWLEHFRAWDDPVSAILEELGPE